MKSIFDVIQKPQRHHQREDMKAVKQYGQGLDGHRLTAMHNTELFYVNVTTKNVTHNQIFF